ncbi:dihydrofolate reductase [Orrella daihaiensis]|uniref:Dihydrofolate reductase n=1 Tax=Orrella daihaiensis TaxID=2782176 RepID=A0ABY4AP08_9BURK|nr:dihydrofolate reductase [Orrella daihaiensis]UOD50770.1 dihydrofolate reductase [Orrella daihaiensis]
MTTVSLIVAYSRNRVIGKDNQLPWKLPGDLAHFKRQTMGKPIIMGRKTWLSLGRPLPGRTNIVVSRSGQGDFTGAVLVHSLEQALGAAGQVDEVCVIGGAQLYADALPKVDKVIATEIDTDVDGDAFFPVLDPNVWVETERQPQPADNHLAYDFVEYRRRT